MVSVVSVVGSEMGCGGGLGLVDGWVPEHEALFAAEHEGIGVVGGFGFEGWGLRGWVFGLVGGVLGAVLLGLLGDAGEGWGCDDCVLASVARGLRGSRTERLAGGATSLLTETEVVEASVVAGD